MLFSCPFGFLFCLECKLLVQGNDNNNRHQIYTATGNPGSSYKLIITAHDNSQICFNKSPLILPMFAYDVEGDWYWSAHYVNEFKVRVKSKYISNNKVKIILSSFCLLFMIQLFTFYDPVVYFGFKWLQTHK